MLQSDSLNKIYVSVLKKQIFTIFPIWLTFALMFMYECDNYNTYDIMV